MPFKLNIPDDQIPKAKQLGAFFDNQLNVWAAPDTQNLNQFKEWINATPGTLIVRAPICLARNSHICSECKKSTNVVSIFARKVFEVDYENEAEQENDNIDIYETWSDSLIDSVTYMSAELSDFIKKYFPSFKQGKDLFDSDNESEENSWVNHCLNCHKAISKYELSIDINQPFFPIEAEDFAKILLIELPIKYDVMIKGCNSAHCGDVGFELCPTIEWTTFGKD